MGAAVHIYQTTRRLIPEDCDCNIHRSHRDFSEYRMREGGIDGACSTHCNDEKCLENVRYKNRKEKTLLRDQGIEGRVMLTLFVVI